MCIPLAHIEASACGIARGNMESAQPAGLAAWTTARAWQTETATLENFGQGAPAFGMPVAGATALPSLFRRQLTTATKADFPVPIAPMASRA